MFVKAITLLLEETRMSDRAFSKKVGINYVQFHKYVQGINKPGLEQIEKIRVYYPDFMKNKQVAAENANSQTTETQPATFSGNINDLVNQMIRMYDENLKLWGKVVDAKDQVIDTHVQYKDKMYKQMENIEGMINNNMKYMRAFEKEVQSELKPLKKLLVKAEA